MDAQKFNCPNCGGPLTYTPGAEGSDSPTIHCQYCDTDVLLPEELRPRRPVQVEYISAPVLPSPPVAVRAQSGGGGWLALAIIVLVLIVVGMLTIPDYFDRQSRTAALVAQQTANAHRLTPAGPQAAGTPTPGPTLTPTPSFANQVSRFGKSGTGPGLLDDARYIAVDGAGDIFVADLQTGRVQRFDANGVYQSQWRVGEKNAFILGMTASHSGDVFVAYDRLIARYDGKTGKLLQQISDPRGGSFGDLYATPDGRLLAVWYQARSGFITSLEGHQEDLFVFDNDGKVLFSVPSVISSHSGALALDVSITADGTGSIYALSDSQIYQFSSEGKYLNRFSGPDELGVTYGIAVDGQGRIYVNSGDKVHVFSAQQRLLDTFSTGALLREFAIDEQGGIWGVASDTVIEYLLRGK